MKPFISMHVNPSRFLTVLLLFLLTAGSLFAQISDSQVIEELKRYRDAGMSQEQIIREMTKKGVTPAQVQRLRDQYLNQEGEAAAAAPSGKSLQDDVLRGEAGFTENPVATEDKGSPTESVYGQSLFSSQNLTFAPNMNMPTPANYVLGPGDEVIIDVWGDSELNVRYTVAPDGHITVPGLGRIQLSGLSVKQAELKIKNEFSTIYSDLGSGEPHTFLAISVGNVRSIKVNVMGEVKRPGTYTLSSFSSAFHALYAAGGTSRIGSIRNIRLFRSGKAVATVDLYEYLMKGNNMADITLQEGDIVMVEPYGILAQAIGEVKRPMWYELKEGETLEDLIRYAGGYSGNAYRGNVSVLRKGSEEMEAHTLGEAQYGTFRLKDGDRAEVSTILDKYANMVEVTGSVYRPGKYAIGEQIRTVGDLIKVAQGTTGDAYLQRALLYRENEDLTRSMQSFSLDALLSGQIADIELRKNDLLHIPSVLSLESDFTVYIGGEVRHPDSYPYAENMTIEDIILRAGGLTEAASTARVDVYRRLRDPSGTAVPKESGERFTFTLADGEIVSSDPGFTLQPYDQVVVRRSPGYEVQQNVTVSGEVLFGGQYAKVSKDERLSSLVERAGGLTPHAYVKGARLTRRLTAAELKQAQEALKLKAEADVTKKEDSVNYEEQLAQVDLSNRPVGIDLEKALKHPGGPEDIILRDGDVLNIPQFEATVRISGGVLYPNTVTYKKNKKLGYYINQAGGYSRLAQKRNPYVVYMNGQVASGYWARIEPGCEIIVPERPEREPMSLQGIMGMTTSLATIALLISNLIK
ncbi:SLBB domain-containing protein [Petrimonas sulfuriphila]|uniref:SLBB domain-containing protein n=1 Tax=Petrimonas sulfuriphila TaxID=285070 RepID=UPI0032522DA1